MISDLRGSGHTRTNSGLELMCMDGEFPIVHSGRILVNVYRIGRSADFEVIVQAL